jgi:hypothetical protein
MGSKEGGTCLKHEDPLWGAYRVLSCTSQHMCPALQEILLPRERSTKLSREKGHIQSMPLGKGGFKGRGGLQPVALQKQLQGGPAGSPHGAAPALNAFHLSAWMPLQVHPANIRAGNFLFTASADGGISLVPYLPFRRVGIGNLASGVEWHGVSQSRWWNLSRLYIMAHVCTSTEGISSARRSNRA